MRRGVVGPDGGPGGGKRQGTVRVVLRATYTIADAPSSGSPPHAHEISTFPHSHPRQHSHFSLARACPPPPPHTHHHHHHHHHHHLAPPCPSTAAHATHPDLGPVEPPELPLSAPLPGDRDAVRDRVGDGGDGDGSTSDVINHDSSKAPEGVNARPRTGQQGEGGAVPVSTPSWVRAWAPSLAGWVCMGAPTRLQSSQEAWTCSGVESTASGKQNTGRGSRPRPPGRDTALAVHSKQGAWKGTVQQ
jgi:hypothetical protein